MVLLVDSLVPQATSAAAGATAVPGVSRMLATSSPHARTSAHGIDYAAYKGLPDLYGAMKWIKEGETTETVPANLVSELGTESTSGFDKSCLAMTGKGVCKFGDTRSKVSMAVAGDSFAEEWIPALDSLGKRDHFKVVAYMRFGCNMASAVVLGPSGTVDQGCASFRDATIHALNSMSPQPALILIAESRYWTWPSGQSVTAAQWATAVNTTLHLLHSKQKEVLFGEASAATDPGQCLAANLTSATACASPVSTVPTPTVNGVAGIVGPAFPVGSTVLMCGTSCPMIADDTLVHSDRFHVSKDFSALVSGAMGELLGCGAYGTLSNKVTDLLLGVKTSAKKAACARLLHNFGWPV